jgi:hypothetical protein
LPWDETFDIGLDKVNDQDYQVPFKFTGKINKLTFKLEPEVKAVAESKAELGPMQAPEPDPIEEAKR